MDLREYTPPHTISLCETSCLVLPRHPPKAAFGSFELVFICDLLFFIAIFHNVEVKLYSIVLGKSRTFNFQSRNLTLYPIELRARVPRTQGGRRVGFLRVYWLFFVLQALLQSLV